MLACSLPASARSPIRQRPCALMRRGARRPGRRGRPNEPNLAARFHQHQGRGADRRPSVREARRFHHAGRAARPVGSVQTGRRLQHRSAPEPRQALGFIRLVDGRGVSRQSPVARAALSCIFFGSGLDRLTGWLVFSNNAAVDTPGVRNGASKTGCNGRRSASEGNSFRRRTAPR